VGPNPDDKGFLRAIKICSMTSCGGEVKPSVKIFWHVKDPYRYEKRYLTGKIQQLLPMFLLLPY
jgi:hypothetical protein